MQMLEERYQRVDMQQNVIPMIHVPDVRATVEWYVSIGFRAVRFNEEDGEMNWALLSLGNSEIMLNSGGRLSSEHRREIDLYVHSDNIDELYLRLKDRLEMVEELHDTCYGMREFIVRDVNRFWITFGQPVKIS
jgi:uncharacterized glyoxalase superfamily protein PhnB